MRVSTVAAGSASGTRSSRIAPHSHIRGLGLDANGFVNNATGAVGAGGFVGQDVAREVSAECQSDPATKINWR